MSVQALNGSGVHPSFGIGDLAARSDLNDGALLAMPTPLHVPTSLWTLSSVAERRVLLAHAEAPPARLPAGEACTVEVRYNPVALNAKHAFVVTTDGDSQNFFRGGPSAGGPSGGSSGQLGSATGGSGSGSSNSGSSNSGGSGNSSSPGSSRGGAGANNGGWGPIVVDQGAYRQGTIDWNPEAIVQQVLTQPGNCDALEARMSHAANAVQSAQIPYNPLSANSNATARTILEGAGVTPPTPSAWVPGWNTNLPTGR